MLLYNRGHHNLPLAQSPDGTLPHTRNPHLEVPFTAQDAQDFECDEQTVTYPAPPLSLSTQIANPTEEKVLMKVIPLRNDVLVSLDADVAEVVDIDGLPNLGESSEMHSASVFRGGTT